MRMSGSIFFLLELNNTVKKKKKAKSEMTFMQDVKRSE